MRIWNMKVATLFALGMAVASGEVGAAPGPCNAPPLPVTGNRVIEVATEAQLQTAMSNLQAGDTILLAPGTYNLSRSLYVNGRNDVTIRGASGCDNVVLVGKGMDNATYGNVPFGVWSNSTNTTIAHLTIRDIYENELLFNAGAQAPHVYSVKLLNAGSQFIKANPTSTGVGVDNAVVEYSWVEYTGATPSHAGQVGYTNGISAHAVDGWMIRGNLFKNLHTPDNATYLWNPAVLMWNRSTNTTTENNVFINVDRAIAYGLQDLSSTGSYDHMGGVIRNNFVYLAPGVFSATRKASSDAAIVVWGSPSSDVYHNTILSNGNLNRSIEFRFTTTGGEARNNLADVPLGSRDGASFAQSGNIFTATPGMFVNPALGDLHLLDNPATRTAVIDKVTAPQAALTDFDGDNRPSGTAADVGADELRTAGSPSPSPAVTPVPTATPSPTTSPRPSPAPSPSPTVTPAPSPTMTPTPTPSPTASPAPKPTSPDTIDTIAPSVAITSPLNGATVRRTVTVTASASDNLGVTKVELWVNGRLVAADAAAPYSFSWNSRPYRGGSTQVTVRAYDAAGNTSTASVTVYVRG